VPLALGIDTFESRAFVTVIPFSIRRNRPIGVPRALSFGFLETNVRTYVRGADGGAGIFFFSLEASSRLAVLAARALYGLPYYLADMSLERRGARAIYRSRRRFGTVAELRAEYTVRETRRPAAFDTLEHFLLERYQLYTMRDDLMYRVRVQHQRYPLCAVALDRLDETLLSAAGLARPSSPECAHYSPGVDVDIYWKEPVLDTTGVKSHQ
jgi:uncharacterized protein YqjF (DUF2071 family)